MTPEQAQEINRLRSLNLSPKEIARKLGLRPASVSAFLKQQIREASLARQATGELAPLEHCLINETAAQQLLEPNQHASEDIDDPQGGFAQILVTRVEGKPFYVNGPYEEPQQIISRLRETVGEGNFEYVIFN